MNDEIKKQIDHCAHNFAVHLLKTDTPDVIRSELESFTAGAATFYDKGLEDGFMLAVNAFGELKICNGMSKIGWGHWLLSQKEALLKGEK